LTHYTGNRLVTDVQSPGSEPGGQRSGGAQMQPVAGKTSEIPWEPAALYPAGALWKVLRRGKEGELQTVLMRFTAGLSRPTRTAT